jgi:hypothetical protein
MHYIIQENVFREQHYDMLREAIERLGLSYTIVRIFPFVEKIVNLEDIVITILNFLLEKLLEYKGMNQEF